MSNDLIQHVVEFRKSGVMNRRDQFLIEMYKEMFNDINRHILVIWQSVGVVVGAFAFLALSEKGIIPLDLAIAVIVLLCGWLSIHLLDAAFWYNRNLVIIENIERQFLKKSDLSDIHSYFGEHRRKNKMIDHLRIQQVLAVGLSLLVLSYHFVIRVWPGMRLPWEYFDPVRAFPYAIAVVVIIYWFSKKQQRDLKYQEFLEISPGIKVSTDGIKYRLGHGSGKTWWEQIRKHWKDLIGS